MNATTQGGTAPRGPAVRFADAVDRAIQAIGHVLMWANAILVVIIILQVVLRYAFREGMVVLEELQWHLYAIGVMFGVSYAVTNDSHIRVDVLHQMYSRRAQRVIDILGILVLALPFVWVVFYHSLDFVYDSWRIGETSDAPLGLSYRWAIKAVIPVSFALTGIALLARMLRETALLFAGEDAQ